MELIINESIESFLCNFIKYDGLTFLVIIYLIQSVVCSLNNRYYIIFTSIDIFKTKLQNLVKIDLNRVVLND